MKFNSKNRMWDIFTFNQMFSCKVKAIWQSRKVSYILLKWIWKSLTYVGGTFVGQRVRLDEGFVCKRWEKNYVLLSRRVLFHYIHCYSSHMWWDWKELEDPNLTIEKFVRYLISVQVNFLDNYFQSFFLFKTKQNNFYQQITDFFLSTQEN